MTATFSAWLLFTFALGAAATLAVWSRTGKYHTAAVIAFLVASGVSFGLMQVPFGNPINGNPPPGRYTVLGSRIDVDVAIYVLLDNGNGEPVYYRLPYSTSDANNLQSAKNAVIGGEGAVTGNFSDGGSPEFYAPPVQGGEPKAPEAPMLEG